MDMVESPPSEMTGMTWRVAEKIAESYFKGTGDVFDFLALDLNLQDEFHAMAIAAIEAMRAPTKEMGLAAWHAQYTSLGSTPEEADTLVAWRASRDADWEHLRHGWSAAISAALNEPVGRER